MAGGAPVSGRRREPAPAQIQEATGSTQGTDTPDAESPPQPDVVGVVPPPAAPVDENDLSYRTYLEDWDFRTWAPRPLPPHPWYPADDGH